MRKRRYPIVILLSCLCLPLAASAASAVYKWTDAQGNVHFSDRPDESPASKRIEVDVVPRSADAPPPPPARPAGASPAPQEQAPLQADAAAQRAIREKNCEIARGTLEHNENIHRMYRLDPDGERVFLSDEEREEVMRRSRDDVAKWCD